MTYPGAYHDFDHPSLPVHMVEGLGVHRVRGRGQVHTGTNPAARARRDRTRYGIPAPLT